MRSLLPSHLTSREGPGCPVPGTAACLCCPGPALQRAWHSWHARCPPAGPRVRAPAGTGSGHRKLLKATTPPSAVSPPGSPWQGGWWGTFSEMRPQDGCSRALGREAWLPSCPRLGQRCDLKSQWEVLRLRMTQRESAFPQRGPHPRCLTTCCLRIWPTAAQHLGIIPHLFSSFSHTHVCSASGTHQVLLPLSAPSVSSPLTAAASTCSPASRLILSHTARGIFLEHKSHHIMPLRAALL